MKDHPKHGELMALLKSAGDAHHEAYRAVDGADPEWPLWYADYLREPLAGLLEADFTKSELVYLLITLDRDIKLNAPGANWARYYANWLLERYG